MKEELSEPFFLCCGGGMEEMVRLGRGGRDPRRCRLREAQEGTHRRACQPCEALHQHRQARGIQQPDKGGEADRLRLP